MENTEKHPGVILKKVIEERKINKSLFANDIGIKASNLSEIFSGKRTISATTSLYIERALSIDAEYWLKLQMKYDLSIARDKISNLNK